MDLGLRNRRGWILGASTGLGKAIATSLAAEGVALAISARDPARLEAAAVELARHNTPVVSVPLDVTDTASIALAADQAIAGLGGLDIVVSNHGGPAPGSIDDIDETAFDTAYRLVLASAFAVTKATLTQLRANRGTLVYLTSTSTKEVIPNLLLSNVLRLGVVGLAKTMSKELGADGVRVLCVAPGRIDTDRVRSIDAGTAARSGRSVGDVRQSSESTIALGRYGQPREIGDVVAFLCSEHASYVSGTTVVIDGGKLWGVQS